MNNTKDFIKQLIEHENKRPGPRIVGIEDPDVTAGHIFILTREDVELLVKEFKNTFISHENYEVSGLIEKMIRFVELK